MYRFRGWIWGLRTVTIAETFQSQAVLPTNDRWYECVPPGRPLHLFQDSLELYTEYTYYTQIKCTIWIPSTVRGRSPKMRNLKNKLDDFQIPSSGNITHSGGGNSIPHSLAASRNSPKIFRRGVKSLLPLWEGEAPMSYRSISHDDIITKRFEFYLKNAYWIFCWTSCVWSAITDCVSWLENAQMGVKISPPSLKYFPPIIEISPP